MIVSMGYGSYYRMDFMRRTDQEKKDHKPPFEDLIDWIDPHEKKTADHKEMINAKDIWGYDDKKFTDMVIEKTLGGEMEINRQLAEDNK